MALEQTPTTERGPAAGAEDGAQSESPRKRVRWAYPIGLALPLMVLNCGWIANSEMKTSVTEITITTLFIGVTFILFVVTLLNLAVRRWIGARAALNQPELMVLFAMLSMSSAVAGIGNFGFLTPFLVNAFWFANKANRWETFWHLLPSYLGPRDHAILSGFYQGHSNFFQPQIMKAWAYPLTAWGLFFLILLWTTLCLSTILRRRWQDEEHLPFPVVALPLEMTREGAPVYRNKLLWAGFAVPCFFHSLNSLHSIYPSLPTLPINQAQDATLGMPYPWTGLDSIPYLLHPCGVGFGYLIDADVLFSLWFFFLLNKVMNLVGVMEGWRDVGHGFYSSDTAQFPFTGYQSWGAWLVFGIAVLWTGRSYFQAYFRRVRRGDPGALDAGEALSARGAVVGFALGFLVLCAFVWVTGGSVWLPIAFLGIYIILMTALSRLQAETAVLYPYLLWVAPQSILTGVTGTVVLSQPDLTHVSVLSWFNLDGRASPMPQELNSLVGVSRAGGGSLRPMAGALMLAAAVSIVAALLWDMQLYYVNGAATANVNFFRINMGEVPFWTLQGWLHNPKPPDTRVLPAMAVGAGVTLLLGALRTRFAGFPLSPAAYVLNTSWANDLFWCDMLVAWIFKSCFLRYGGIKMYRQGLPFFLGLILGDFVTGSCWSIFGALMHLDLYRTF